VVVDVAEHGGLDIPAAVEAVGAAAAGGQRGAVGDALGDVALEDDGSSRISTGSVVTTRARAVVVLGC
jgi:hypothetical protein